MGLLLGSDAIMRDKNFMMDGGLIWVYIYIYTYIAYQYITDCMMRLLRYVHHTRLAPGRDVLQVWHLRRPAPMVGELAAPSSVGVPFTFDLGHRVASGLPRRRRGSSIPGVVRRAAKFAASLERGRDEIHHPRLFCHRLPSIPTRGPSINPVLFV